MRLRREGRRIRCTWALGLLALSISVFWSALGSRDGSTPPAAGEVASRAECTSDTPRSVSLPQSILQPGRSAPTRLPAPAEPASAGRPAEVLLDRGLGDLELAALAAAGARVVRPLGADRSLWRVTDDGLAALRAHPAVRSAELAAPAPQEKIAESLRLAGAPPLLVLVRFYEDQSPAAEAAGLPVVEWLDPRNAVARAPTFAAVESTAARPEVYQLWPPPPDPVAANLEAAQVSNVQALWPGGGSGQDLDGAGIALGMWDDGPVAGHRELTGRVTNLAGGVVSWHSTHVAGTLIATGVDANAHGMAPAARLEARAYGFGAFQQWYNERAALDVANNSWGYPAGWVLQGSTWTWRGPAASSTDPNFGKYTWACEDADAATQYDDVLAVAASGNQRDAQGPGAGQSHQHIDQPGTFADTHEPNDRRGGYDTLSPFAAAKNVLVVGAVDSGRYLGSFSGSGPTDDARVKPDLVAKGVTVYSCDSSSSAAYVYASGTSAAAPVVSGVAGLVTQRLRRAGLTDPPASLVRAALIHTATDLGSEGPDGETGWGLVDASAAVALVASANYRAASLDPGASAEFPIEVASGAAIRVTLVWADPPGRANTGSADDATPALVYDLDLRVIGPSGATFYPWRLTAVPSAAAVRGDNRVDTVEQVLVPASEVAAGTYRVRISTDSTLLGALPYSLASSHGLDGQGTNPAPPPAEQPPATTPTSRSSSGGGKTSGAPCQAAGAPFDLSSAILLLALTVGLGGGLRASRDRHASAFRPGPLDRVPLRGVVHGIDPLRFEA